MNDFVSGALTMGYAIAGLYFLRFWKQSRDRLFVWFASAFWTLAFQRLLLTLFAPPAVGSEARAEGHILFYFVRLLAFVLVLIGIIDKNRAPARSVEED